MHTTRILARRRALTPSAASRTLTTAANAEPIHVTSYSSSSSSVIPLSNIEAQWEKLSAEEQTSVHAQLEELQKKDWRKLSIDEKKAGASPVFSFFFVFRQSFPLTEVCCCLLAYYVAFGPHGPRTPTSPPGTNMKVFLATLGLVGVAGLLFEGIRANGM